MAILEVKNIITELRRQKLHLVIDEKQKRELARWKISPFKNLN